MSYPSPIAHHASLSKVRGKLRSQADIGKNTWFQVGGKAEWLFKPEDAQDLADFMRGLPKELAVMVIGVGSNLLVRDGGIDGVVIRLGRGFTGIEVAYPSRLREQGEGTFAGQAFPPPDLISSPRGSLTKSSSPASGRGNNAEEIFIHAGAGALDVNVAMVAQLHGIAGLEFLCGIPGTVGGALAMNAGAYGSDIAQILVEAQAVDGEGNIRTIGAKDMDFSYRKNGLPKDWIFTQATFRGVKGDKEEIAARMEHIRSERENTQPVRSRTGGSTFKNPDGQKAWQLIDEAGCRGLKIGGAQVSEKHCNFLINTGNATAADLENLGEEVRAWVKAKFGVELEWEIKVIGNS